MSEYPIPEDLKDDYEAWKQGRTARYNIQEWMKCGCLLIERIARLEAEKAALSKPITDEENFHYSDLVVSHRIEASAYIKERLEYFFNKFSSGEKWSLYRAVAKLVIAARAAK